MRDKIDAIEFSRKVDRSHHSNIRIVVPPAIDSYLEKPKNIKFSFKGNNVILTNDD